MMGKLQMDREWTEQDLRTFAEGAQAAFETVLLDELPQDTGWQDEGLQVSYSLCNGRVSCVLHRTVRADGKLWQITMSAPLAGNLLPEERMSARERLSLLCDEGSFCEIGESLRSTNSLDFPGSCAART